jgi:hypothetical protein
LEIFAEVRMMVDNEILIMAAFLGAGLLAYVSFPGSSLSGTGSSTTWNHRKGVSPEMEKNEVLRLGDQTKKV